MGETLEEGVRRLHRAMLERREALSRLALGAGYAPSDLCWEERTAGTGAPMPLGPLADPVALWSRWDLMHGESWLGGVEVVSEGGAIVVRPTAAAPGVR